MPTSVIANAAFVVNLFGLMLAGWASDILSLPIVGFLAAGFIVGAYASATWVFKGKL